MVFGKVVFVKFFDLVKIVFGEVVFIVVFCYVFDYFGLESVDGVDLMEGCYCLVQFVGFVWCEFGGNDCDFYCLFLKQWYVYGFVQNCFQFFVGIGYFFFVLLLVQIRMDYVFLDWIGMDDGDFNYQIVELVWLELGQYGYLGLIFYLEYFDVVGMVEYVVDWCFFGWNG